jgi:hypothetical protein
VAKRKYTPSGREFLGSGLAEEAAKDVKGSIFRVEEEVKKATGEGQQPAPFDQAERKQSEDEQRLEAIRAEQEGEKYRREAAAQAQLYGNRSEEAKIREELAKKKAVEAAKKRR